MVKNLFRPARQPRLFVVVNICNNELRGLLLFPAGDFFSFPGGTCNTLLYYYYNVYTSVYTFIIIPISIIRCTSSFPHEFVNRANIRRTQFRFIPNYYYSYYYMRVVSRDPPEIPLYNASIILYFVSHF